MKTRILLAVIISLIITPLNAQKKISDAAAAAKAEEGFTFVPVVELKPHL